MDRIRIFSKLVSETRVFLFILKLSKKFIFTQCKVPMENPDYFGLLIVFKKLNTFCWMFFNFALLTDCISGNGSLRHMTYFFCQE